MSYTYEKVYVNDAYPSVTAKQANENFDEGNPGFTRETKFFCNKNCSAEISCANYTVDFKDDRNKNKRAPYFVNRKQNPHDKNCSRWELLRERRRGQRKQQTFYNQEGNKYVIEFLPGEGLLPSVSIPTHTTTNEAGSTANLSNSTKTKSSSSLSPQNRTKHLHDLKEIIDLFEEYQDGNKYIELFDKNREKIKFSDIFEEIAWGKGKSTNVSNLSKIYYGQAHASNKDGYIVVTFSGPISLGIHKAFVQFNIYENDCNNNGMEEFYKLLSQLANDFDSDKFKRESYFTLYYEGTFTINETKYKTFININQPEFKFILDHIHVTPN
ncbi:MULTISPECIES: hypothetical protein [unclassified Lactococcus]|uniref:hypothetical protein n=1 Tax=unclassified Lactococcus TaxID=2643510 RepID=UPI0011C8ADA8|nr:MULTISPECIES: hypothetical protein [unclassified Lactococcus]MQW23428.1 hypothetical protein [Lactococcus sp. dk101]TXK37060.1 hypothetical protein FVP42_10060 [Lactococcus sp. dk310]TXK37292.1 hypothetical protein FVP42_09290 [Lactococcus sp. dk310]TXK47712.1 hypothetical protein FVP43_09795 [Lactococcus sp. dk322]